MFIESFKVESPHVKVMLVGWVETMVSTLTGGVIANKELGISWATKDKIQQANYFGSLTQASAIRVGSFQGEEIYAPFKSLLPMVNPEDIVFGGWDISNMNLADAMARARVFDIDLQKQLRPYMESMVPLPGIYDPDFIAANQGDRSLRKLPRLTRNESEISPSTLYALACVLENVPFIMEALRTPLSQPTSIVSYNHLGNNDGMNLSAPQTFRSKEISKSNVVDDMVNSNAILYEPGEHPDHVVVIKYVPYVGDSKRAMDEYTSEIFMGGKNTIVLHNTCEDSLLAAPIILDLVLLAELSTRIQFKAENEDKFHSFHPVATILSYLTKAPLVSPTRYTVVNALSKQRAMLENILRACVGLAPENNMILEYK
ncbi:hypothetical protein SESBI_30963 [Sesbania bispinosa]|nr:hypothetical protein SESBI_30963 [Sesbania bispinosa]